MRFVITMTVGADEEGDELLDWLVYHLVDERRADIMRALKAGRVAIDRQPVSDPRMRLVAGLDVGFQQAGDDPDSASPWGPTRSGRLAVSRSRDGKPPLPRDK
jgi:hypothetical protein